MSVVELCDVSKSFRQVPLLRHVSARFEDGGAYCIAGPDGSGKSVLVKLICGLLTPDSGQIRIDPRYLGHNRSFPESFGVLVDGAAVLPGRTGLENLQALARLRGVAREPHLRAAMERVGLDPCLKRRVGSYSAGMRRRLGLASALMEGQQVLLLDEPLAGLDPDTTRDIRRVLAGLRAEGRTLIVTTQRPAELGGLGCARYRITRGTLAALGRPGRPGSAPWVCPTPH